MKLSIKNSKSLIATLSIVGLTASLLVVAPEASAQIEKGLTAAGADMDQGASVDNIIANIVNVFLYIVGAVAIIMVIFGGFQYITSAGDSTKATKARNTIVYAIVGLVLAAFAYAIINYVLENVVGG